jgi:hypothetical protein
LSQFVEALDQFFFKLESKFVFGEVS